MQSPQPARLRFVSVGRLALAAAVLGLPVLAAGVDRGAARWEEWNVLRMKARKALFFSGTVTLDRHRDHGRVDLRTETVAHFMGADLNRTKTRTRVGKDGRPRSYESRTKKRGRRYRFDAKGYVVERFKPGSAGWQAPFSDWNKHAEQRFTYPEDAEGRPRPVVDYYTMILSLAEAPLAKVGDSATFWVATSDGPQAYRVTAAETRNKTRRIRGLDKRRRSETRSELRLRIAPVDPENAKEGFLKMEGETELWVDAETKTLIELSGVIPKVPGRVVLTLDRLH